MSIAGNSRRRFLRTLLSGATTLVLAPSLLHGESAFAEDACLGNAGDRLEPILHEAIGKIRNVQGGMAVR